MLTDLKLKGLKAKPKPYKVADRDGLYVQVSPAGGLLFRYDYRLPGDGKLRREKLALGRYDATRAKELPRELADLEYGAGMSLAEARLLLTRARRTVERGESPSREKVAKRARVRAEVTLDGWAAKYFEDAGIADSTRNMRQAIYDRDIKQTFGRLRMDEVTPSALMALCEKIKKDRDAPATAVHVREIVSHIFKYVQSRGIKVVNPADSVRASAIATFKPRERALTPEEIRVFFTTLAGVGTFPQLKLGLKLILLTMVRKGELLGAVWDEIDFEAATWSIPAARMKSRRPHVVYLSEQAIDLLVGLKACAGSSPYLLPGRYETGQPMTPQALNRVIVATIAKAKEQGNILADFSPHDLRRTASTMLHEAGFNSDWIEKCLAHEQRGVRAVYNRAEYSGQRRELLQAWADMVDAFIAGSVTDSSWHRVVALMGEGNKWVDVVPMLKAGNVVAIRGAA